MNVDRSKTVAQNVVDLFAKLGRTRQANRRGGPRWKDWELDLFTLAQEERQRLAQVVTFCDEKEGDTVTALYLNGELRREGDYYHNHIDDWVEGFLEGYQPSETQYWEVTVPDMTYGWSGAAQLFHDIPYEKVQCENSST